MISRAPFYTITVEEYLSPVLDQAEEAKGRRCGCLIIDSAAITLGAFGNAGEGTLIDFLSIDELKRHMIRYRCSDSDRPGLMLELPLSDWR
jgi:hypothetical protein